MPWNELIGAFITSLPRRLEEEKISNTNDLMKNLKEFRILTIGGHKKCGKSTAAFKIVRENKHARLMGFQSTGFPSLDKNDTVVRSRIFTTNDLIKDNLIGLKILVVDTNGFHNHKNNPFDVLLRVYYKHHDWFDPEFSIIHIL